MNTSYQGACHCGAVRFSFQGKPITGGVRCNCSICKRKGALMSLEAVAPEHFNIDATPEALGLYQFGAQTAKHYFCKHCGIYPFHITARKPGHYRVNLGCIDQVDTLSLPSEIFDGRNLL